MPGSAGERSSESSDLQARRPVAGRSRCHPFAFAAFGVCRTTTPYSEAQFKTLKYCPAFPGRFGSIDDARGFCEVFFDHYNHVHRHAGIGLHTPASVHCGTATEIQAARAKTLRTASDANPARFRHRPPRPPKLPDVASINEPDREALIQSA